MKEQTLLRTLELAQPDQGDVRRCAIYAEQVKILYRHAPISAIAVPFNAFLVATVHVGLLSGWLIWGWALVLLTMSVARSALSRAFWKSAKREQDSERWCQRFVAGAVASAIVWGATPLLFYHSGSQPHQLFLAFVLAGMASGAIVIFSPIRAAAMLYVLFVLTPLICVLFASQNPIHLAMGGMSLLFSGVLIVASYRINAILVDALALRYENEGLLGEIKKKNDALLQKNAELDTALRLARETGAPVTARVRIQEWE